MSVNIQDYVFLDENSQSAASGEMVLGGQYQTLTLSVYSATSVSLTIQCKLADGSNTYFNVGCIENKTFEHKSTITANGVYSVDVVAVDKVQIISGGTIGSVQVLGVAVNFEGSTLIYGFPTTNIANPAWNTWINLTTPINRLSCVLPNPAADISSEIRFTFTTASSLLSPFFDLTAPPGYIVLSDYANPQMLPNIVYQASLFSLDQEVTISGTTYKAIGLIVYPWERVTSS